jgi:hypothetical protein
VEPPYPGHAYARTHPDHLAWLARLHALSPADPDDCRVLELACGDGMNVIAMAAAAPGVRVTGVDLDGGAIARGQAVVDELGLAERVDLRVADLTELPHLGPADYVICHGLYTWAPPRVADAALAALAAHLAPAGVGFLSFNLRPGWTVRRALGPALANHGGDPRALLAALEPALEDREDAYGQLLAAERRRLSDTTDALLVHDDLGPHTTAAWYSDVVAHADHHGLRILRDAHPDTLRDGPVADQGLADLAWGQPYREVALIPATAPASAQPSVDADALPVAPRRFATAPGERPLAYPLARLQARESADVTTLRHTRLTILDEVGRAILVACDGTRSVSDLAAAFGAEVVAGALEQLAANALLLPAAPRSPAA